jgi:uncharacterized protein YpbB
MWYKVKIKLKDSQEVIEDYIQANSIEEIKQILFDNYTDQIHTIRASLSLPPE